MAAAGFQAEAAMRATMENYKGRYVLVVEGSPSVDANGVYCTIAGRSSVDILREAAAGAAAVIATGNCAAFGGIPKAKPNPTGARAVSEIITDKPVINIPGCPAIPEVTTGTIAHFLVMGALPKTDSLKRPLTFYGHTVHDHCLRRPFYDSGKFAGRFDDAGARAGHCLYKLGCKGPTTYNACSATRWNEGLSFPIQSGHGCIGCSEDDFWDKGSFYDHLTTIKVPGLGGAEGTADKIGLTAAVGVGAAIAAHAAVSAIMQARSKTRNDKVSEVEK
jgi:hydrogenase small subunit